MAKETLRIAIYGMFRGRNIARELVNVPRAQVVAVCDRNNHKLEAGRPYYKGDVKFFNKYDDMLEWGQFDAVILTNTYNEHAPCAIAALEKGIAVFSETAPATTMKEMLELVEAVERTGGFYSLAENYPHIRGCRELTRVYRSGVLGNVSYAEGEYIHPMDPKDAVIYFVGPTPAKPGEAIGSAGPTTSYRMDAYSPTMIAQGQTGMIGKGKRSEEVISP